MSKAIVRIFENYNIPNFITDGSFLGGKRTK
jgi:hypothetical protein